MRSPVAKNPFPVVLTIAGSDSGGGAGIQADLKVFHSLGCFGTSAISCVTAQNFEGVSHVEALSAENISAQIKAVHSCFPVVALKTGMLFSAEIVEAVVKAIRNFRGNIVVDPVMVSRAGSVLLQPNAIAAYEKGLFPRATILTPNRHEAAVLLNSDLESLDGERAAKALWQKYTVPVVVKGNQKGDQKIDYFCDQNGVRAIASTRIEGVNTHGTGCSFGAAITAYLAKGESLFAACKKAKVFIENMLMHPHLLKDGRKVLGI